MRLRISLQAWFALLALILTVIIIIANGPLFVGFAWVLFGAVLISLAFRPLVDKLAERRIPRAVTMLGVYIFLILLLASLGDLLDPVVSSEVALFRQRGPALVNQIITEISKVSFLKGLIPSPSSIAATVGQNINGIISSVIGTVAGLSTLALHIFVALVLGYFFAADNRPRGPLFLSAIPLEHRPRAQEFLDHLTHRMRRWIWAQITIAAGFALLFGAGLRALGVPFAITIALVGGAIEIIPYLGGIVALLLGVLSALTVQPLLALWVAILYLVVVEIEVHVIEPAFYGQVIGLHPAVVLIALLIGAQMQGIVGALFAVPIAIIVTEFVHVLRNDHGDGSASAAPPAKAGGEEGGNPPEAPPSEPPQ